VRNPDQIRRAADRAASSDTADQASPYVDVLAGYRWADANRVWYGVHWNPSDLASTGWMDDIIEGSS
jgi:hypothetical protein